MKKLEHADKIHLRAAEGWLGLGDLVSASEELDQITPEFRIHPAVLVMRIEIYHKAEKWDYVIPIAETLVQQVPKISDGWIQRSFALHVLKRTLEAYDLLLPAVKLFPKLWVIRYNLACYACKLGKLKIATEWLRQAIDLAEKDEDIRQQALEDPDLETLWKLIPAI